MSGELPPHQDLLLQGWLPVDRAGHLGSLLPPLLLLSRHRRGVGRHPWLVQSEGQPALLRDEGVAEGPRVGLGGDDAGNLSIFSLGDRESGWCSLCPPTLDPDL